MRNFRRIGFAAGLLSTTLFAANPLSRGTTGTGSPSANLGTLTDGIWGQSSWTAASGASIAFSIPSGHERLFLTFDTPSYTWSDSVAASGSCKQGGNWYHPASYKIETSANSTNGTDGSWTAQVTVANNLVSSRGHLVDFKAQTWIRFSIVQGSGPMDEIEVFDGGTGPIDAKSLQEDAWFFMGTSISANTWKSSPQPDSGFAKLVAARKPARAPAVIRGGIGCINSTQAAGDFGKYFANAGQCRFWAIEMGTNDAWGGNTGNLAAFRIAIAKILDSAIAHGITPYLARMIATNPSASGSEMSKSPWQVNSEYLRVIDSFNLVKSKPGPDLHAWFLAHPEELNVDGVHPNATGGASIQKLWAEVAAAASVTTSVTPGGIRKNVPLARWVRLSGEATPGVRVDGRASSAAAGVDIVLPR